jgi:flagellar biosynthesis/type III secretory pathway protein FliH
MINQYEEGYRKGYLEGKKESLEEALELINKERIVINDMKCNPKPTITFEITKDTIEKK